MDAASALMETALTYKTKDFPAGSGLGTNPLLG
jgi:hypothetical protein